MSEVSQVPAIGPGRHDERLLHTLLLTRLMRRPELGAIASLILVIIFFAFTASPTMFTLEGMMTIVSP